ncbi:type I secretion C-terminal target domain-containing protein [Vreelandella sp. V005]|uniref:type I secretion C-terminal target domain-containing protein n=1 Tax=Vreelandella sp. V005 TaxID=3459608 RepID=UPI004043FA70
MVGQTVATFTASDEEDGMLTAGAGQVTFTPGSNGDGYYAFDGENVTLTQAGVDAINAGTTLPPVSLTATDSGGLTATDSDTPSYVINSVVAISEEGLDNGIPDTGAGAGYSDSTNSTTASGTLSIAGDTGSSLTVGIDLTSLPTGLASGGEEITWDYLGGNHAIAVGSTSNGEAIRIELNDGNTSVANPSATSSVGYEVTLSAPVDHPENSLEDTLNFDFDVNIVDGNNASSTGTVTVVVEDDMPIVNADSNDLNVVVNELAVGGLSVAWSNVSGANGGVLNNQPAGQDDVISWGGSNGKSNYTFDDNDDLIANNSVSVNSMFELGEFTHNNFVVSQSINSVDLDLSLNILINGYSATIKHTINFDHNETSNSGADPRDIVTIKNASTIVPVEITNGNGEIETYNFQIIGFVDQNNNIVSNVFTNENASNSYKLMAKLVSSDAPDVSGQLEYAFGADGPSDEEAVVWNNGNGVSTKENGDIEVQGKFGILTVSEDGSYTYKLDQGAYDQLDAGEKETESFTYTLTDGDGDSVKSALDINITGEAAPLNPNNVSIGTNAGETVESKGGDDLLIGDQGGKKTVIEKGQDYNISLMLDASQSMSAQSGTGSLSRFQLAKNALKSLVDDLSNHDGIVNVQLLAFSDSAWKVAEINGLSAANVKGLKSQIDSISQNTWTNYEDAFIKSKAWFDKQADSDSFKDVAYFLTDGDPTAYNHNSGNVKTTGGYDTNKATMEKAIEAFSALKGVDVHAIGIGGGVSQNLLEFFDNTGLVIENDSVRVNGGKVYGSTGKVDIVNSAEDLQAVLQGGSEREEPADVGNDILRGSDGDNIIFGDALEHADYPGMGVQGIKNYLQAENGAEPSDEALAAFIRENHESLVMPTEQGGDDVLIGGAGNDVLYGVAGADTFAWEFGDQGTTNNPAEDQVMDFHLGEFGVDNEADRLDLADLLQDEDSSNIDGYIFAEQQGDDTVLHVKSDGGLTADGSNADQHIVLKGVEMPQGGNSSDFIQSMLDNDQLKIDQ